MKMNLLLHLILNGFAPIVFCLQPVAPTLYLIKQALTWPNARSYCKAMYTDLAPVKTYDDLLKIREEAARQGVSGPTWIGLYIDMNSWRWSFHDLSLSAITLRKWKPNEPNNYTGAEACGVITTRGSWIDCPCSELKPFICYNAEYPGDSRFVGIASPMNWTDAQTYCRRFHTDLATALDVTENNLLQQVASGQGESWFGLYRDGWTWSDHTKALNIYWASGQPNNYYKDENCGRFLGGLFEDMDCTSGHYFFCHYTPPIKRKIMKLQVTSDQNVFDAAVQSSLLMKIMQKLEELGMLNITVTWRVQPDGNIFYKKNDDL